MTPSRVARNPLHLGMATTYDYDQLRAAIRIVRNSLNLEAVLDAATVLADYTEATLNLSDEVDGR